MADNDEDIIAEALELFAADEDAWSEVKAQALDDMKFGRLAEQWPTDIMTRRRAAGRPCMTINRMPGFIRQVVNDGRQNRPSIKVRPVDSGADVQTAEIYSGLIRHIEAISDADVAYDTALDNQASGGFGFATVDVDYACDDSFDLEIKINQVANPMAVTWPSDTEAFDSSDWDHAFLSSKMPEKKFKAQYPGKTSDAGGLKSDKHLRDWFESGSVRLSKYYRREEKLRKIVLLSDQTVVDLDLYVAQKAIFDAAGVQFVRQRESKSYEIVIRLITGMEILETKRWRGSIIPVIPFYGDSFSIEGERHFNSLIHDAKDAQRSFNYSRSTATEMISLQPKTPFIGRSGTFDTDAEKWTNVNTESFSFIEYDGNEPPQRQPFAGVPTGALQEAELASEDMKAIIGISNPSLGMPDSRVISGKAKQMERHESDTGTYHFTDNQHRSIRCIGRVLVELIPQVYGGDRIVRILGHDGKAQSVALAKTPQPLPGMPPQPPRPPEGFARAFDLAAGKYDLAVEAGPSYTTRREEAVDALSTLITADPAVAPIIGPQLVKMYDMPDSEKITAMLATLMPPAARAIFDGTPPPPPTPPPELAAAQAKAQADMAISQQKAQQDFQLEQQKASNRAQIEQQQAQADIAVMQLKAQAEIEIDRQRAGVQAELKRQEAQLAAELKMMGAAQIQPIPAPMQSPGVM